MHRQASRPVEMIDESRRRRVVRAALRYRDDPPSAGCRIA
ncbi:hypothetical protein BIFDEN_00423 [Bifidobacterium dentium ATCC 27678]|nr:hypothetical protein BIFDEN_00423 [Bifidobacterium dentium ATCC 27678]